MKKGLKRLFIALSFLFLIWYIFFSLPRDLFTTPTSTVLYAEDGQLLGARVATDDQWRFSEGDSLSEKYKTAVVKFEDAWFYWHPGFNPVSIARALYQNIKAGKVVSGGSTISMQLIRLSRKNPPRTVWEKLYEIVLATRLELRYSKSEILNLYASNAPFGGNVVGIEAAAYRYFNRNSFDLSWAEAATLGVLPNAPGLIRPGKAEEKLQAKRDKLLRKLLVEGIIDSTELQLAELETLPQKPYAIPQKAEHLLALAETKQQGKQVFSTLNAGWQQKLGEVLNSYKRKYAGNGIYNAAAVLVEVETGAIKAYVGNQARPIKLHGEFNDMLQTPRSSGSILKPFLYANMLQSGELLPKQLVADIPISLGGFTPENYIEQYDGAVAADEALYRSLNIPAVLMLRDYGIGRFKSDLQRLGFSTLGGSADYYGLSLILGGAEVTAYELAQGYTLMAQSLNAYNTSGAALKNRFTPIHWQATDTVQKVKNSVELGAWHYTLKAMKKVNRPNSEMGWEFFNSGNIAWKTGTSFGFRDAWAVGITNKYVCVVWVGNADGEGRPGLVGAEMAGPILFDILNSTHTQANFLTPYNEMQEAEICSKSGLLASNVCPKTYLEFLPIKAANSVKSCVYHQTFLVDAVSKNRVNRSCRSSNFITDTFFTLPPAQAWYYAKQHNDYRFLPAWADHCNPQQQSEMEILYPRNGSTYYLPYDLNEKQHSLVAEMALLQASKTLYWHLNGLYLGTTEEFHQLPLQMKSGQHILTVTDEAGNSVESGFEVVGKGE